ncbi:LysR substrate-binding domain-containing protein [Zeaxanthinibacter enoshimensis]|uniref:DNA-binding transcriptional LysR family regulator n=1 Tax=Zeaxanthinibacter enoshimensis TaxID=392009 RepID=A0A4R6TLN7_9FLAO|nr:LysR substrate-binding domain-containing protein [Zeaxanthinibacter enoshimensis]TDQ29071.1 DNA-binding transcriptional LysR family regulator [Zeaxanthinibacter enoshimensis]
MISKSNQLELRELRSFVVLAGTLHYGRAAEELHLSQSALSQQIMQLERMLGHKLFDRTNRRVALSKAGELLLPEAGRILQQVESSVSSWERTMAGQAGQLNIGFVGSAMQSYLPPLLKSFSASHPEIRFTLEELTNAEQLEGLEHGLIDIAFMRSNRVPEDVQLQSVFTENLCLVLPQDHPLDASSFRDMSQVAEESFVLFPNENSPRYYQQIQNLCADHGFSPRIAHRSIHGPTIFSLVENGMGISIIPNSLRDKQQYKVKFIELTDIPQKTELFAAWKKGNENPALPRFKRAIDLETR